MALCSDDLLKIEKLLQKQMSPTLKRLDKIEGRLKRLDKVEGKINGIEAKISQIPVTNTDAVPPVDKNH